MKNNPKLQLRQGFTLIELLVVIVIIVTLMGILVPIVGSARKKAVKLQATNDLSSLVNSVDAYYNTYNRLPSNTLSPPSGDLQVETTEPIMSILAGINLNQMNRKQQSFYTGGEAKGNSKASAKGGIWRDNNSAELYDPWRKKQNRGYILFLDYDYNGTLQDPFRPGRQIARRAVAWSTGKDGQWSASNPKKGDNEDNVYSWF